MDYRELLRPMNLMSLSRIPIAVIMVFFFHNSVIFLFLLAVAIVSDGLDGWLARKQGPTPLGAAIDPFADKVFVAILVLALLVFGRLGLWHLLVLMLRDFYVTGLVIILATHPMRGKLKKNIRSRIPGKITTHFQFAALLWAYLMMPGLVCLVIGAGVASIVAIVDYTLQVKWTLE